MVTEIWIVINKIFCYFGQFAALLPPKNQKNQNFEKMKKSPGDIIILHKCTKNHDHMIYCSRDMALEGYIIVIFHFGLLFAFLPPRLPKKQKSEKSEKNAWRYHHFTHVHQKS